MGQPEKSITPFNNTGHTPGDCGVRRIAILDHEEPEDTTGFVREHTENWEKRPALDEDERFR